MPRRWSIFCGLLLVLATLSSCEVATVPPIAEPTPKPIDTVPAPQPTPVPWPAEHFIFPYLEKIWLAPGAPPYALTVGEAPALSPDGQRVAYLLPISPTSNLSQVYVLEVGTGQIFLASSAPAFYGQPVWSPDSRSLAYVSGAILVVTDPRGEVQRALVTDVGSLGEGIPLPAWSVDSQTIVCPLTRIGPPDLFSIQVADGQSQRVSFTGGYSTTAPFVVVPADTLVAKKDSVLYVNPSDGGTVWLAGLDGANRQRVLPEIDHVAGLMRLSADGKRLVGLRRGAGEKVDTLWFVDMMTGKVYRGGEVGAAFDALGWSQDGRFFYWLEGTRLYRYGLALGTGQAIAMLPPPTPLPTATPLPVAQRLVYFADNAFYEAEPYGHPERIKEVPASVSVLTGYTLRKGTVAFVRGADVYVLQIQGGVATRLYTFQQEKLVSIRVVWSQQGNSLLYTAIYEEEGAAFGRRVDVGLINLRPSSSDFMETVRFAVLPDRSGAAPVFYDEGSKEAIIAAWGAGTDFNSLEVYDVVSGTLAALLDVQGDSAAAISDDGRWAATTVYDPAAGRGQIRLYDLTAAEQISKTFDLAAGTFTLGPLYWSPDNQYLTFIPLSGNPDSSDSQPQGIWVLKPDTLEATEVVSLTLEQVYLVGFERP